MCFFNAIQHLPVGMAPLLEHLVPCWWRAGYGTGSGPAGRPWPEPHGAPEIVEVPVSLLIRGSGEIPSLSADG